MKPDRVAKNPSQTENTASGWAYKAAWEGLSITKRLFHLTGLARLRWGGYSLREAARRCARYVLYKLMVPSPTRPYMIQGHRIYLVGGPSVLYSFDMAADRFEAGTTRLFGRLLREGMTVVDVGAHVGYYTLLAARLVGAKGKVYAFEPDPPTYRLLLENVGLNGYQNVYASNLAVYSQTGQADFFVNDIWGTGPRRWNCIYPPESASKGRAVPTTTLDDFLEKEGNPPLDLVKIDIDGGEMIALGGMEKLLRRPYPPKLIIEFYPEGLRASGANPLDLPSRLMALNFRVFVIGEDQLYRIVTPEGLCSPSPDDLGRAVNLFCEK